METDTPSNPSASASKPLDRLPTRNPGKQPLFPKPDDLLRLGEFVFELGCAYCLHKLPSMQEMLSHHLSAHQGPHKIFYVLRWWDSATRYWMCPLCEHVEMDEGASTSQHHAFQHHNEEEICEPHRMTSTKDVRAFVLHHWDTTLKVLLHGRMLSSQFQSDECSSMSLMQLEHDDVLLKDYLPAWRQNLLGGARVKPQLRLPARVWRSWVETGNESMMCRLCAQSRCLSLEDVMQSHMEDHVLRRLYFCPYCHYNQTYVSLVVNHVAFTHRAEMLEVHSFLGSSVPAVAGAGTDVAYDKNKYFRIAPNPAQVVNTVSVTPTQNAKRRNTSGAKKTVYVYGQGNTPPDMSFRTPPTTSNPPDAVPLKDAQRRDTSGASKTVYIHQQINTPPDMSFMKPGTMPTPPDAVPLKDYMLICAYCGHKARTCDLMVQHYGQCHKCLVRKVFYMVHHEGYKQSHWACPLCRFVREEDEKHIVQLHVFFKHGREDMLYPGLQYASANFHKYLALLWTSVVVPCLKLNGEASMTDLLEKTIVVRHPGLFVKLATTSPTTSSNVANGGTYTSATPTMMTSTSTPVSASQPVSSQKLSSISDQIVLLDDDEASQDNDDEEEEMPKIVEIEHLNKDMQRALQEAYTQTQWSKTCCKLCDYSIMGPAVKSQLFEHMMLHLGDEIWLCPYCYLHKTRRCHMTAHLAHTHPTEPLRVMRYIPSYSLNILMLKTLKNIYMWICSLCSRKDTRNKLMIEHLRLGHPEREFSVCNLHKGFLMEINEDRMKGILQKQKLKPRVRLHRAETFRRHPFMQQFWIENDVQVVALLDLKRGREALEEAAESDTTANNAEASAQESMDTETKDGEGPGTDPRDAESPSTETERKDAESPSTEIKREDAESPSTDIERKDAESSSTEIKREDAESPSTETERKDAESPSTEIKREDAESPSTEIERKDAESPSTEIKKEDAESPSTEIEKKDAESPSTEIDRKRAENQSTVTDPKDVEGPSPSKKPCLSWVEYDLSDIVSGGSQSPNPLYRYVCPGKDCYFVTDIWLEMYDHLDHHHANDKLGKLPRNPRLPINAS